MEIYKIDKRANEVSKIDRKYNVGGLGFGV